MSLQSSFMKTHSRRKPTWSLHQNNYDSYNQLFLCLFLCHCEGIFHKLFESDPRELRFEFVTQSQHTLQLSYWTVFLALFLDSFFLPHFKLILFHHTWSAPFINKTQHKEYVVLYVYRLVIIFLHCALITTCLIIYSFVYLLSVSNPFHTRMQALEGQGVCFIHYCILRI